MSRILLLIDDLAAQRTLEDVLRAAHQTPVAPPRDWATAGSLAERVAAARPDVVVFGLEAGLEATLARVRALADAETTRYVPLMAAALTTPAPSAAQALLDGGLRDVVALDAPPPLIAARVDNMAALSYLRRTFRRQNDALAARTAELDRVFETATTGLAIADPAGHVVRLNEAGRTILGGLATPAGVYRVADTEGQPVGHEAHPLYRAAVHGEQVPSARFQLVGEGASPPRMLALEAVPLEAPGGMVTGGLAVFRDETATWALEEELRRRAALLGERTEEMEAFVYTASHDMKGPLLNIRRFARMLIEDNPDIEPDSRHFLQRIEVNADRLSRLVQDLLQVVKVGKMELVREPCDLSVVVRAAQQGLETLVHEADAIIELADDLPTADGDFDRLVDVFANLLSNAIKYRRPGQPCVVRVRRAEAEPGTAHVVVEDDGRGVPEDQQTRIFGLFHRLHTRDQIEGSGLGLGIVTRVVGRHGGRVWVESDGATGSAFHVELPTP